MGNSSSTVEIINYALIESLKKAREDKVAKTPAMTGAETAPLTTAERAAETLDMTIEM